MTDSTTPVAPAAGVASFLFRPVDIASLVAFRIMFGAIMAWEAWRFLTNGWIDEYYVEPRLHFTYLGFDWVRPWPGDLMTWHFGGLLLLAVFIALGFMYRLSAVLFFLGFSYVFLLEQCRYLNHFYLVILVSFIAIFLPAHGSLSLDARLRPRLRRETVPAWAPGLVKAQMGIVYVFAAIAKCNGDWVRGFPLRMWLAERDAMPFIGPLFHEPWMALLFSYSGLMLDLLAAPLLLWRRSRPFIFAMLLAFHAMNHELFGIGIFPFLSIALTLTFFSPGWPRKIFNWPRRDDVPDVLPPTRGRARLVTGLLALYFAVQVLVPLRHFLYEGDPSWNEEGHRYSWHMKLRSKGGRGTFEVRDPETGEVWVVDPKRHLKSWQVRKMLTRPYMAIQFAHYLRDEWRAKGHADVQVYARVYVSLNGRKKQLYIDPNVDLAQAERTFFAPLPFVLPLTEPLRYPR